LTFRRFVMQSLLICFFVIVVFGAFNYYRDEFGLFRDVEGRKIRIYTSERVVKYLLSFRYIPINYNGIIVGPSLSDEFDPSKLDRYKIYNLSIAGGNISQVRLCAENVIRRGNIKLLIVCLDPFLTRESGLNDRRLAPRMCWSVLGSTFTFRYYWDKVERTLFPQKDTFADSYDGKCNLAKKNMQKHLDPATEINAFADSIVQTKAKLTIDPRAFDELAELLRMARQNNVRIFAFYYPQPAKVTRAWNGQYRQYQEKIDTLFTPRDTLCDFNSDAYRAFREDYTNYSDQGHLSIKGADFLVGELNKRITID
jgi:hypothetical protein